MANVKSNKVFGSGVENENNCGVRTEQKALCFIRGSKVERKASVLHLAQILEIRTSEVMIRESSLEAEIC